MQEVSPTQLGFLPQLSSQESVRHPLQGRARGRLRGRRKKVALTYDDICTGAVGVAGDVLVGVVGDALLNLGKGLAADEFGAHNAELDIGKAPVRLIAFFVHKTGGVFADYYLNAIVQEVCAVLYLRRYLGNVIQCCIYGRG